MTKTPLGQALIKALKEAVEMKKGIPMKSYEETELEALKEWSEKWQVTSPKVQANFLDGYQAGHARALKASEGLVNSIKDLMKKWVISEADCTVSYDILRKALEQFQREVGK